MQAVYLVPTREGGKYEYREVDRPEPRGSQVLVQVKAAGINRGEILMVAGFRSSNPKLKPVPAGIEFAGEIVEVGPDATGWHVGERVMGRGMGSYAEFMVAGAMTLMRIPDGLSFAEAAAIPNVFITAHDALVTNARVQKGDHVVVTAASSGIGTATTQLARLFGARSVVGTTRDATKIQAISNIGADLVIDTSKPGYVDAVKKATMNNGADIIVDSVGGPMLADNLEALAVKGRIVSVGRNGGTVGQCDLDLVANKRARIIGTTFRTRTPQEAWRCFEVFVEDCLDAFADGRLKPVLDRSFPFDRLHDAHEYMLADGQVGKIVLAYD